MMSAQEFEELDTRSVYVRILTVANYFLVQARLFSIEELKQATDPSVSDQVRRIKMLANIIKELAADTYDDESMALNAFQCCLLMERCVIAIDKSDSIELDSLTGQLEKHINVP